MRKGKSFPLKQTYSYLACCHREGVFTWWMEDGKCVAACLFVWDKIGEGGEKKIPPRVEQFPKHIWSVFLKWLSSNLCLCAFVCVCHRCILLMMLSVLLASWMHTRVSPGKRWRRYISSCVRHARTRRAAFPSPPPSFLLSCEALLGCLSSSRNRECVTKHILSDSHAIFPWSRPRLLFMVGLPATLRRRLLWTLLLPCGKEGGCIA